MAIPEEGGVGLPQVFSAVGFTGAGVIRRGSFKYWAPVFAWAALIFVYSSMPEPLPAIPGIPHLDKVIHTCEYAVLSFLLIRALKRTSEQKTAKFNAYLLAVLISILYGLTDEFHQLFVPNRDMSIFDLFFDGVGVTIGKFLWKTNLRRTRVGGDRGGGATRRGPFL